MSPPRFDEILLVRTRGSRDDRAVVAIIEKEAAARGVAVRTVEETRGARPLVLSVGGDGTLLHALALSGGRFPLTGVNLGRLGYLADFPPERLEHDLPLLLEGAGRSDRRLLLAVETDPRGNAPALALNDLVVGKNDGGRMIEIETWIDGRFVRRHRGDGLVVATATGSTAYALSCGGPILDPTLPVFVLVPISPHNLTERPLVVAASSRIELRVPSPHAARAVLSRDGTAVALPPDGRVRVARASRDLTLLHPPDYDPYTVLRTKLHWGTLPGGERC
jgi:NAD+ kinase